MGAGTDLRSYSLTSSLRRGTILLETKAREINQTGWVNPSDQIKPLGLRHRHGVEQPVITPERILLEPYRQLRHFSSPLRGFLGVQVSLQPPFQTDVFGRGEEPGFDPICS